MGQGGRGPVRRSQRAAQRPTRGRARPGCTLKLVRFRVEHPEEVDPRTVVNVALFSAGLDDLARFPALHTAEVTREPNRDRVLRALRENENAVHNTLLGLMAHLGAREEWSMEDNVATTETIAALAGQVGLPSAGDQSGEDLAFWRSLDPEYEPDDDVAPWQTDLHTPTTGATTAQGKPGGPGL